MLVLGCFARILVQGNLPRQLFCELSLVPASTWHGASWTPYPLGTQISIGILCVSFSDSFDWKTAEGQSSHRDAMMTYQIYVVEIFCTVRTGIPVCW